MAIPASMHASDDPIAEVPTASWVSGAFQRSASMWTQRRSISAAVGYSSLSIRFLLIERAMSFMTSSDSHVWQKVARFWCALPSRSISRLTISKVIRRSVAWSGNRNLSISEERWPIASARSSTSERLCSMAPACPAAGLPRFTLAG